MSLLLWGAGHSFLNPPGTPFITENHVHVSVSVMQIDTSALFYQASFRKRVGEFPEWEHPLTAKVIKTKIYKQKPGSYYSNCTVSAI